MQLYKKSLVLLLLLVTAGSLRSFSQSLPDSVTKKIDTLFAKWNNKTTPGCAIGIIRHDSLIYAKGYGMANLEYDIPNTAETPFHMASISKQFTAWSIALLARQGKLTLDDDVRKYLHWFPDLKTKISIRNLLNHTSGIRDQWQLLAISGTRLDDVITQDHIVKILSKQTGLNFMPGEQYSYSNSGFTMLAEIVKAVSKQTLRQFTDSAIFKPLGMAHTHFHDDYTEIEKNRSYSYSRTDSTHFSNAVLNYSVAGATSLFTTVNDLAKWAMNFYTHTSGDQALVDTLTKKGLLKSGKALDYADGIAVDTYRGWKQYSHGGADAGYRTYLSVFPDLKMGVIVFSNIDEFNAGGRAHDIASLLIKDTTSKKNTDKPLRTDSIAAVLKDSISIKKYVGTYVGEEGIPFSFSIIRGKLYYQVFDERSYLVRSSKDSFFHPQSPNTKFMFSIRGTDTIADISSGNEYYHVLKFTEDTSHADSKLKMYTGVYFCPELDCKYSIELKDHKLLLGNAKYNDSELTLVAPDHLRNDNWWIDHLHMLRGNNGAISGFEINSGRIMHLRFNKIE